MRYITLGNDRKITINSYVAGVKHAIDHPAAQYKHGLTGWWPCTGQEIREQFLRGVHDRINKHLCITSDMPVITLRTHKKLLRNIAKHGGRSCDWCGQRFVPKHINYHFCSRDCHKAYYL